MRLPKIDASSRDGRRQKRSAGAAALVLGLLAVVPVSAIASSLDIALANRPGWLWNGETNWNAAKWLSGSNLASNAWNQAYSTTDNGKCITANVTYGSYLFVGLNSQSMHCAPSWAGDFPVVLYNISGDELFMKPSVYISGANGCHQLVPSLNVYDYGTQQTNTFNFYCEISHVNMPVNIGMFAEPGDAYGVRAEDSSVHASLGLKTIRDLGIIPDGHEVSDNHGRVIGYADTSSGSGAGFIGSAEVNSGDLALPLSSNYWSKGENLDLMSIVHTSFPVGTTSYEIDVKRYSKDVILEKIDYGQTSTIELGEGSIITGYWGGGEDTYYSEDISAHRDVFFANSEEFKSQYAITISYYKLEYGMETLIEKKVLHSGGRRGVAYGGLYDSQAYRLSSFLGPMGSEPEEGGAW